MWNHYNPTFVCTGPERHCFKSDVHALADNDRLRLAPCPTCGGELEIGDLLHGLLDAPPPTFVPGLVWGTSIRALPHSGCGTTFLVKSNTAGLHRTARIADGIAGRVRDGAGGHREKAMPVVDAPRVVHPPQASEPNPVEHFFRELRRARSRS